MRFATLCCRFPLRSSQEEKTPKSGRDREEDMVTATNAATQLDMDSNRVVLRARIEVGEAFGFVDNGPNRSE